MAIITVSGLIGSGKDTVAKYLVNEYGYQQASFASSLKDAVAAIFCWPREMLEGATTESRAWRETVDPWWSKRLGIPALTPRWVLQNMGTDVLRRYFHDDIWIASLERRVHNSTCGIVISDCRFPNEIDALRKLGARQVRVKRGAEPVWYHTAKAAILTGDHSVMQHSFPEVHSSEYSWVNTVFDTVIENNSTLTDLYAKLDSLVRTVNCPGPTTTLDTQFL